MPFRPHVTVQNKAEPSDAKALLETLQHTFDPFDILAEGLLIWRCLGGPWEPIDRFEFPMARARRTCRHWASLLRSEPPGCHRPPGV